MSSNKFSASAPMLGYIYQVRYALLLALKKMREVDDPDESYISIEKLDDIAFEEKGNPAELLQTKFHATPGNITDRSSDIWKTIRVWSSSITSGKVSLGETIFTLVTTQKPALNSLAAYLGQDVRKEDLALKMLQMISQETNNLNNQTAYDAFNLLDDAQKKHFVSTIYILGESASFDSIENEIQKQLIISIKPNHMTAFSQRLDGYWFKKVISLLGTAEGGVICLGELQTFINDLHEQFLPQNLPSDYAAAEPDEMNVDADQRTFLQQMRLISAPKSAMERAITNYYRAVEQRNRWSRDVLVNPGELAEFDRRIKDEWMQIKSQLDFDADLSTNAGKLKYGKDLYSGCQSEEMPKIRAGFVEPFLSRGTVHKLADDLTIGWHPNYLVLIQNDDAGVA